MRWAYGEIERQMRHHGYFLGWCSGCQEWRECPGNTPSEQPKHTPDPDAHVCVSCGEPLANLPPF